jgi:hypothetical protein
MTRRSGALVVMAVALGLAGTAQATPFFEVVGGNRERQNFSGTPIIENDAYGFENRMADNPADVQPCDDRICIYLRDTTATSGTRQIRFDYVGTDADFTNQFNNSLDGTLDSGTVRWCNKSDPNDCNTALGYEALGTGSLDWFGSFGNPGDPGVAVLTMAIGELVPFTFIAACAVCAPVPNPDRVVTNGENAPGSTSNEFDAEAHMGVYNISSGAFIKTLPSMEQDRTGTIFALGVTDGNFGPTDDDHQDFMVRLSVPEPSAWALSALPLGWLAVARRRLRSS